MMRLLDLSGKSLVPKMIDHKVTKAKKVSIASVLKKMTQCPDCKSKVKNSLTEAYCIKCGLVMC